MRSGFFCLLVAAGCNSIFGSHDVINGSTDADVRPKDAAPYTMYLTALTVDTTNAPAMNPDVAPTTPAVAATVAAGKLGAAPQPLDLNGDGSFSIPFELAQDVYRMVYTPPDGVPVEIQGKLQTAHFVVPSIGRPDAVAAPSNAILGDVTPAGGPTPSYTNFHLFSIGTFAVRLAGNLSRIGNSTNWTTNAMQVDAIQSMSGALYTPEMAKGDRIVVTDGDATDQAVGFSVGTIPDFSAGFVVPAMAPWKTVTDVGNQQMKWGYASSQMETSDRVMAATPSASWTNDNPQSGMYVPPFVYGGVLPTTKLPNFVESGGGYVESSGNPLNRWTSRGHGGLGVPIYLPLTQTTLQGTVTMVHAFNGTDAPAYPTAMFVRYSRSGVVEGVTLTAGIQTIALANNTSVTNVPVSVGLVNSATQHMTLNGQDIFIDSGAPYIISNAPAQMDFVFGLDKPATTD
ncbi:MAG TPA: hypothetical protein VFQ65_21520, partial [Kofleriaceae bacterium]|nr:hypothetical protein [Kofleriaceae bacterium]